MVAALVMPWRQVPSLVAQATIVNNRILYKYTVKTCAVAALVIQ